MTRAVPCNEPVGVPPPNPPRDTGARKQHRGRVPRYVGLVLAPVVFAAFFWLGGGVRWYRGWLWLGVTVIGQAISTLVVRAKDPELIRRRGEYGEGTKSWDKLLLGLFAGVYVGVLAAAVLDVRLGLAEPLAWWWSALGVAFYALGTSLLTWAMRVNTHFEKTIRIQLDRDHEVVQTGPYRIVRHPGYVATILSFAVATPMLLGSTVAFIPAAAVVVVLVIRTALEDRTLRAELSGYADYAARTRHRLVPGIW